MHIAGRHAFETLAQHVMRLPVGRDVLRREFEFLTRLVADVPLRRLRFPHASDRLDDVRAAVQADLQAEEHLTNEQARTPRSPH